MDKETGTQYPAANVTVVHGSPSNYELFILGLTIYSLVVAVAIVVASSPAVDSILYWSDLLVCLIFFIDFLVRMRQAKSKLNYFLRQGGWLDLLGSIPAVPGLPWTALLRFARLNRFTRIIQGVRGGDQHEPAAKSRGSRAGTVLLSMVLFALVLLTVASLVVLRFERGAPGASITTGATAFWWAFVTMTTVGYGDYVPVTDLGRLLAIGLMTFGIGIFAVLTSFLASKFVVQKNDQEDVIAVVLNENAAIRAELAELKDLIRQQNEMDE
jgi:voltage-gated potassium channel